MTPQTNDAYNGSLRDIVFPAGILQPPIFDADADPAINYGAAGGVIGHELTHGFDDQGRKIDASGALHDWWTKKDADTFQAVSRLRLTPIALRSKDNRRRCSMVTRAISACSSGGRKPGAEKPATITLKGRS
jgi:hypothetical protein